MSKQNTPISDKIKEIQDGIDRLPTSQRIIAEGIIDLLKTILPAERQAIIDAYASGVNDEYEHHVNNEPRLEDNAFYYEQTYEI